MKSVNKVTINMYDKELMPLVDDLYLNDQSMQLLQMKQEGRQEEINDIFESFVSQNEDQLGMAALQEKTDSVKHEPYFGFVGGVEDEEITQDDDDEPVKTQIK